MKITAARGDGFVKSPTAGVWAVLVYGPDRGLVRERVEALISAFGVDAADPFALAALSDDAVKTDPARLEDEMRALSLTGGARAVRLSVSGDVAAGPVTDLIGALDAKAWTPSAHLIADAGALSARSKIRKAFEGAQTAAALPCYADDVGAVAALMDQTLDAAKISLTDEARAVLPGRLEGDRALARAELEKLTLFAADRSDPVTKDEVDALIVGAEPGDVQAVADAALSGDAAGADAAYGRALDAGATPVGVMLALQRSVLRLQMLRLSVDGGLPVDSALNGARPPVFGPARTRAKAQLQTWTAAKLSDAVAKLLAAERTLKSAGVADASVCGRLVLAIAMAGRRRR